MLGPAGRRPVLVTFAHNLQMTALKLDRKHNRIGCRYNPGKGKQITYTYAYIKFKKKRWSVVADAQKNA